MKTMRKLTGEILNEVREGSRVFIDCGGEVVYTSAVCGVKYAAAGLCVFETANSVYAVKPRTRRVFAA